VDVRELKRRIREEVWTRMERAGVSRPPLPIRGRIPNFIGAERAARNLIELELFKKAEVVFVNPDSPQFYVRLAALEAGKTLVVPTPRIRSGFLVLKDVPRSKAWEASTIRGMFKYGRRVDALDLRIDLKVQGSVAVDLRGARLGKGHGFGDLEYAILRELGVVDERTPIVTTVHELQIVDEIPMQIHDVPVDMVITPSRIVAIERRYPRPPGIIWDLVDSRMLEEIPILRLLKLNKVG